jgi:hypothetical protein
MSINYEFMNELMSDPQIAAMLRQRELGLDMQGGGPTPLPAPADMGPTGTPLPAPVDAPPSMATPAGGPPASPGPAPSPMDMPGPSPTAGPIPGGAPPPPAPDSPLGQLLAMQPKGPGERTASIDAPDGSALLYNPAGSPGPMPTVPQPPQQGGFLGRLKVALPRMATAAIAAGATPSQYGGGPLDIFRGMQAGGQELERKDTLAYNRGRQQSLDTLERRKTEAEIGHSNAASKYYDAESEWRKAQAGKAEHVSAADDLYAKMNAATDPKQKEEYHQLWLQSLGHAPKDQPTQIRTRFGVFDTKTGEYITLDQQQMQKDRIGQLRQVKGLNPQLWPDWAVMQKATPEEKMFVLSGTWKPDKETNMNPTEMYMQAAGGDAKKAVDLMQRPQLTAQDVHEKQARMAKLRLADQQYQEELRKAEHEYNVGKAKLDAAGARPGTVDPKGNHSKINWDQYNQQNQVLIQQLTDAKNAAHRAHEAAAAELNPEGYTPHAGYNPDGTAVGAVTRPGAKSYMDNKFPGGM